MTELILVAPLSVLSNWEKQIEDHCVEGALSYYIYYGSKRVGSASDLSAYDVVITTYQTVVGEWNDTGSSNGKKRKTERALFDVKWKVCLFDLIIILSSSYYLARCAGRGSHHKESKDPERQGLHCAYSLPPMGIERNTNRTC